MAVGSEWKTRPPGADAADTMRKLLHRWLTDLEEGEAEGVRRSLREERWLSDYDLEGVPDEVIRDTREILSEAEAALRPGERAEASRDAIQRALVIW